MSPEPSLRTLDYSVLQQCMHCGMCLPTCPTYDATKRERNSPRGRIALMRAIADGDLEVTTSFADEMSYCLGCLACQTACPAGVNYSDLQNDVRKTLALNLLENETLALAEIAFSLGYSDVSAFNHAFRRWVGQSPGHYRRLRAVHFKSAAAKKSEPPASA